MVETETHNNQKKKKFLQHFHTVKFNIIYEFMHVFDM